MLIGRRLCLSLPRGFGYLSATTSLSQILLANFSSSFQLLLKASQNISKIFFFINMQRWTMGGYSIGKSDFEHLQNQSEDHHYYLTVDSHQSKLQCDYPSNSKWSSDHFDVQLGGFGTRRRFAAQHPQSIKNVLYQPLQLSTLCSRQESLGVSWLHEPRYSPIIAHLLYFF